jgi:hypothetical protein
MDTVAAGRCRLINDASFKLDWGACTPSPQVAGTSTSGTFAQRANHCQSQPSRTYLGAAFKPFVVGSRLEKVGVDPGKLVEKQLARQLGP